MPVDITPRLKAPENGACHSSSRLIFYWYPVEGADRYSLEVYKAPELGGRNLFFMRSRIVMTFYVGEGFPQDGTTYYWRLYAHLKDENAWSLPSEVRSVKSDFMCMLQPPVIPEPPIPPPPPELECEPGTTKCVGFDLYRCQLGTDYKWKWILAFPNYAGCGYVPPTPPPTPPPPPQPEGTFASLFTFLAAIVGGIGEFFGTLEDAADSIPLIGDKLASPFRWIKDYCQDIEVSLDTFDITASWVDTTLRDIRPWVWINDAVSGTFFSNKAPLTWFADNFGDRIALDFSWLLDPFTSVWDNIKDLVLALIPTDFVTPWEVWGYVVDYVRDLISEIDIPSVPTFDDIWDWIRARYKDLDDISLDPASWFSGMLKAFLTFATLPFWWVIEDFLNRIWWEEE